MTGDDDLSQINELTLYYRNFVILWKFRKDQSYVDTKMASADNSLK